MAIFGGIMKHLNRMRGMRQGTAKQVVAALYSMGQEIELEAERSITRGSISGKNHVASAPGQPPNRDTGHLDNNIITTIVAQSPPTVHIVSNARYSAALEYGTSKMEERPFMRPAVIKLRKNVSEEIAKTVKAKMR